MKRVKTLYPPPVIVASFAQGEHIRLSFHQPAAKAGKPIAWRFDAARDMACSIIGNERQRDAWDCDSRLAPFGKPATDLLECRIEWNGEAVEHASTIKRVVPQSAFADISGGAAPVLAPPAATIEPAPIMAPIVVPPIPAPPMASPMPMVAPPRKSAPAAMSAFDRVRAELLSRRAA